MIAFGPVPSRRLGKSLGINNIPPKSCTYSCVYCQLGKTTNMLINRQKFYDPQELFSIVKKKVDDVRDNNEHIDYLTFVPDGEPTLDINLGKEVELLKSLDMKVGIITNASLLWKDDVREDLYKFDWVSLKIDSADGGIWRKINRAYGSLKLEKILEGVLEFSHKFSGELVTETMLIKDINDHEKELKNIADFIVKIHPKKSYISVPIRPPAERWVRIPSEDALNRAYHIFKDVNINTEYLAGYEGNAFASTGNIETDILSITSVHPIREEGMEELLKKAEVGWDIIEKLIDSRKIVEVIYRGKKFYVRNFDEMT